jgi:omega-hydroxy-beta-dihydromenaquinone-9 sulfotransferase
MPTPAKRPSRRWAPRFFQGTDAVTWARLLYRNRFAVSPRYWYIAAIVSVASTANLVLRWVQDGLYGDELARTPLDKHPVFVIGHWRTGTTLLHELLVQDPQFSYPDFFACFNPNHRLLTERFFKTYANWMAPQQRPMDNMAAGWGRPQEDEFALALLGLPSTYTDLAFPRRPPQHPGSLDLSRTCSTSSRTPGSSTSSATRTSCSRRRSTCGGRWPGGTGSSRRRPTGSRSGCTASSG